MHVALSTNILKGFNKETGQIFMKVSAIQENSVMYTIIRVSRNTLALKEKRLIIGWKIAYLFIHEKIYSASLPNSLEG